MAIQSVRDMYDSGEWVDATMAGADFEVQINQRNGQYRHRPMAYHLPPGMESNEEWRMGNAPKGGDSRG